MMIGDIGDILVFPAASRPSINSRISLDPKILAIILDIDAPILSNACYAQLGSRPQVCLVKAVWAEVCTATSRGSAGGNWRGRVNWGRGRLVADDRRQSGCKESSGAYLGGCSGILWESR